MNERLTKRCYREPLFLKSREGDLVSIVIKKGLYSNRENKKPRTKLTKGIEIDISCHIRLHDYSTTMVHIQNISFEGLVA